MHIRYPRWPRERVIAFSFIALVLLLANWASAVVSFPYDAGLYWDLGQTSTLHAFPHTFRGYLWPYILIPAHTIDQWTGIQTPWAWRIISSLIYSLLFTGPVAELFKRSFGGRLSIARRSWMAIATLVIFPGLFLYPLSDLPAALFLVCGILLTDSRHGRRWVIRCLASGALVAAAYNTRTIYMLAFLAMLALVPLFFFRGRPVWTRAVALLAFVLGAAIVCVPQAVINKRLYGVASPLVQTSSLMASQLYWGVTLQRYETSIRHDVPSASLFYRDQAGIAFNSEFPGYLSKHTILNYATTVIAHPLFFFGAYGRHLVNGIDVRDGMVYTDELSKNRTIWSLFCFTLFAFCTFVLSTRDTKNWAEWGYLAPLLVVVVGILPGAIETRFLMPLYLLLFGAVATRFEWSYFASQLRRHWASIVVGYVGLASIWLAITSSTMAQLRYVFP
ncbi:MAG: hypothetical protein ABI389_13560 [Rhodanobacter sp.]